jgi:hypothetical protein
MKEPRPRVARIAPCNPQMMITFSPRAPLPGKEELEVVAILSRLILQVASGHGALEVNDDAS